MLHEGAPLPPETEFGHSDEKKKKSSVFRRNKLASAIALSGALHAGAAFHEQIRDASSVAATHVRENIDAIAHEIKTTRRGVVTNEELGLATLRVSAAKGVENKEIIVPKNFDWAHFYLWDEVDQNHLTKKEAAEKETVAHDEITRFKKLAEINPDKLRVLHEIMNTRGGYDPKKPYVSSLFITPTEAAKGKRQYGDCKAHAKRALSIVSQVYPELPIKIQVSADPHERAVVQIDNTWYALEDTVVPLTPKDIEGTVLVPTSNFLADRLGIKKESEPVKKTEKIDKLYSHGGLSDGFDLLPSTVHPSATVFAPHESPRTEAHQRTFDEAQSLLTADNARPASKRRATAAGLLDAESPHNPRAMELVEFSAREMTKEERSAEVEKQKDPYEITFRDKLAREKGFYFVGQFIRDLAMAKAHEGAYVINKKGDKLHGPFWDVETYDDGTRRITNSDMTQYYLSASGKRLCPDVREVSEINNGLAKIITDDKKISLLDIRTEKLAELPSITWGRARYVIPVSGTSFWFSTKARWDKVKLYDLHGQRVGAVELDSVEHVADSGLTIGRVEGVFVLIDPQGNQIGGVFSSLSYPENGLMIGMPFPSDHKQYHVNEVGEIVSPGFQRIDTFKDGLCRVSINDIFFYVNREYKVVSPGYAMASEFSEGCAVVKETGAAHGMKNHFIDTHFVTRSPEFGDIGEHKYGRAIAQPSTAPFRGQNLVDLKGVIKIQEYDQITLLEEVADMPTQNTDFHGIWFVYDKPPDRNRQDSTYFCIDKDGKKVFSDFLKAFPDVEKVLAK